MLFMMNCDFHTGSLKIRTVGREGRVVTNKECSAYDFNNVDNNLDDP